jgi:hypothetical protein
MKRFGSTENSIEVGNLRYVILSLQKPLYARWHSGMERVGFENLVSRLNLYLVRKRECAMWLQQKAWPEFSGGVRRQSEKYLNSW